MSDEYAEEKQDNIDPEIEVLEDEAETAETEDTENEEIEIYLEGEEEPAHPTPVRHNRSFKNRLDKLKGKVVAADERTSESDRRVSMLEEENKLLRLKAQQGMTNQEPRVENFDTDEEFDAANRKYQSDLINQQIADGVAAGLAKGQTDVSTVEKEKDTERKFAEYYQKADDLKVSDFDDTEDRAIELLGNDTAKFIMSNNKNAHLIMYHLGKPRNEAKAREINSLVSKGDVYNALEKVVELGLSIKTRSKRSQVADPEKQLDGGGLVTETKSRFLAGATFS